MFVSCAEEDRISNLPQHLIEPILERLPVEEAVRTSIISKKWRYKWTTMRALVFDRHFSNKFAKNGAFSRNGFISIIYKVLFLHNGPISKFHLHIPNMFIDSFQEIDQFLLLLSRNGVTEIKLTNLNRRYKLPSYIFSCLELRKLTLENCFLKLPLEFEGFLNLEQLSLTNIDFRADLCGTQINFPQLKELSLYSCPNVYNFNINATKLQCLYVINCPDAMLLRLLHSPCLIKAGIYHLARLSRNSASRSLFSKLNLIILLSNLLRLGILYLDIHFLKFLIAEKIPELLPHASSRLKHLHLLDSDLGDLDQLHGALFLLQKSPHLKYLIVTSVEKGPRVDVGPATNHLESPNCLGCTLDQLQTVEITYLKGSKPELLFIKLLLAHSPSLEKFTITPSGEIDVQKRLEIAKDVMSFPRASPKAKIIYLDPEP